ncbi:hypothetical protein HYFRA_00008047 [Hymenoscyphus fraxineus]|uniref:BAH domain-containing protein n=1 Tax=Hymenoscyphus fraxineus TaxID=746836 RepID=A0A9N9KTJ0_9HELO|nr:hypothetical protein HYFRA_00008047 [Hymenoscyphus fraxineus]
MKKKRQAPRPEPHKTEKHQLSPEVEMADRTMETFTVTYPARMPTEEQIQLGALTAVQRKLVNDSELIKSPFNPTRADVGELDQRVCITPPEAWYSMKKYVNFVIQGETYTSDQVVFVRSDQTPPEDAKPDAKTFWVAKILQVRAASPQHVYALISWLYWPEELPPPAKRSSDQVSPKGGKRKYHGAQELVASNYLDILDVLTFAGKADVVEWDEAGDYIPAGERKYYWRQTFCRQTQALSKIREHCVCLGPCTPEIQMYICDNPDCKLWLHKICMLEYTLSEALKNLDPEVDTDSGILKKNHRANKPLYSGILAGKIEDKDNDPPKIIIHDLRREHKKSWQEWLKCPACKTKIE